MQKCSGIFPQNVLLITKTPLLFLNKSGRGGVIFVCLFNTLSQVWLGYIGYWLAPQVLGTAVLEPLAVVRYNRVNTVTLTHLLQIISEIIGAGGFQCLTNTL